MAFVDDFVGLLRLDDSFFGARSSLEEDFTTTIPVEVVEAEVVLVDAPFDDCPSGSSVAAAAA